MSDPLEKAGLRPWLAAVEALGELRAIDGADWNLEMGAMTELAMRELNPPPALLFDRIPGYAAGQRVLFGMLGSPRRIALTLGLPLELAENKKQLVRAVHERFLQAERPMPPSIVAHGPVLENVIEEASVDLLSFPAPFHHVHDGGRYLASGGAVVTRAPDGAPVNLGTYRVMVVDGHHVALHMTAGKHGRQHLDAWLKRGLPCPVAICCGIDPLLFLAATSELPPNVSEYDFCGAIRGAPVEVVERPETGLPIPADAEMVIEGEILAENVPEGPFGEWAGYYANNGLDPVPEPLIRVRRVLHRTDPILTAAQPGRPPSDCTLFVCIARAGLVWSQMEKAGVPGIEGVWRLPSGGGRNLTVVSIKQQYAGHALQAGTVAAQCAAGAYVGRYVIVVDDDIDPSSEHEVLWALATRSDPIESIQVLGRARSSSADPRVPMSRKGAGGRGGMHNSIAIIEATRPWEWRDQFPPVAASDHATLDGVRSRWGKALGL